MAATLHIVPSDNFRRKRLHGELDIESINREYETRKRLRHNLGKYTPPPSSSSSSSSSSDTSLSEGLEHVLSAYTYNKKEELNSNGSDASESASADEPLKKPKTSNRKKPKRKLLVSTTTTSTENKNLTTDTLEANSDYISLCSALNLLYAQRQKVQGDIVELSTLKKGLKLNPTMLASVLSDGGSKIPSRNRVVKCPIIDFTKYGIAHQDDQDFIHKGLSRCENSEAFNLVRIASPFN